MTTDTKLNKKEKNNTNGRWSICMKHTHTHTHTLEDGRETAQRKSHTKPKHFEKQKIYIRTQISNTYLMNNVVSANYDHFVDYPNGTSTS